MGMGGFFHNKYNLGGLSIMRGNGYQFLVDVKLALLPPIRVAGIVD